MRLAWVLAALAGLAFAPSAAAREAVFEAGVELGYGQSSANVTIPAYPSRFDEDSESVIAGVFAGAYAPVHGVWSAGLEVSSDWSNRRSRAATGLGSEQYAIERNWDGAARLRIGRQWDAATLGYAAFGAAWTHVRAQYVPQAGGIDGHTLSGWTIAAGLERRLAGNAFVRAELRHARYDDAHFQHLGPSRVDFTSTALLTGAGFTF